MKHINYSIIIGIFSFVLAASGCGGGGGAGSSSANDSGGAAIPEAQVPVLGAAVKGPLKGADASLYLIDFSQSDLKGELLDTGITDDSGALTELNIPGARITEGPFLLEYTGGTELNGSTPVLGTLRAFIDNEQAISRQSIYATPLTTLVIEAARVSAQLSNADTAQENFVVALREQQDVAISVFGLGVLDDLNSVNAAGHDKNLFTTAPMLTENIANDNLALSYRTVIEVLAALLSELNTLAPNTNADQLLVALARDVVDGVPDGADGGEPIVGFDELAAGDVVATLTRDTAELLSLPIPGTDRPISELNLLLIEQMTAERFSAPILFSPSIDPIIADTGTGGGDDSGSGSGGNNSGDGNGNGNGNGDGSNDNNDGGGNGGGDTSGLLADAGSYPSLAVNTNLLLSAAASSGNPVVYSWRCLDGPLGGSNDSFADTSEVTVNFSIAGDYLYELTVSDESESDVDTVTITVDPDVQHANGAIALDIRLQSVSLSTLGNAPVPLGGDLDGTLGLVLTSPGGSDGGNLLAANSVQGLWSMDLTAYYGLIASSTTPRADTFLVTPPFTVFAMDSSTLGGESLFFSLGSGTVDANDGSALSSGGASNCNDVAGWGFCGSIPSAGNYDLIQLWLKPSADRSRVEVGRMVISEFGASNTTTYTFSVSPP